jgi:prepilin-type N-terminal cleavage/methylation domain-containing protein
MKISAFTLIELLVVIAIVGILSGLIVVSMNGMAQKATMAKAQIFSNSLRNSLMANIVSEWKFDGTGITDGNTIDTTYTQDTWGSSAGTIIGTPKAYSGSNCVNGSCIYLNGSTDYISHTQIHFADLAPHTFSVWVKWGTTLPASFVIPFGVASGGSNDIYFTVSSNKIFQYRANGQTGTSITGSNTTTIFDNYWHNVVWTVDSSRNIKLYIDSTQNGSTTAIATSTEIYYSKIGCGYSTSYMWNGYIDELRIFSDSLNISQIQEQYYAGLNKLLNNGSISQLEYLERIKNETAQI